MNDRRKRPLYWLLSLALLSTGVVVATGATEPPAASADGRVVILGFDGADARTVRELVEARPGQYPAFERLMKEGTFLPLEVVAPPESPVSWAALNTGQNPAKTGVPGFVKRQLEDGRPPRPALGHLKNETRPIDYFDNVPIPTWGPTTMAAVCGAVAFLVVFLLAFVIARRFVVALVAGLVVGGAGAYAGHTVRGYLPDNVPHTENPNQARNFWDFAGDAGVPCVIIDPAQAFDMPAPDGVKVLAGLGVPDARGGIGDWFIYTTDPNEFSRPPQGRGDGLTGGTVFRVDEYDGEIQTKVYGPKNFWLEGKLQKEIDAADAQLKKPDLALQKSLDLSERINELKSRLRDVKLERTSVDMTIRKQGGKASVTIGGQTQELAEGQWSEFYELSFELNDLLHVDAITRVRIRHLDSPHFEVFVNVLDIDPREPPFWQPISTPFGFSAELASECGLYETYGWSTATMPFKDGLVEPEVLLSDVEFTMDWRERLTYAQLEKDDWRCLMSVFSTTDRVQHMMYRYYDEDHPRHDPEMANHVVDFFGEPTPLKETIPMIYKQMDRVIGEVLSRLEPNDTFIVCSDHGFQSFRRQVHVNNLLAELGYLKVKPLNKKSDGDQLRFVDWKNTQAYSLGMGFVYLNLEGREFEGAVKRDEADEVLRRLKADLLQARDPDTGERLCKEVYITKEVHQGDYLSMESEILLGFAPTYRVSWASTFGGMSVQADDLGGFEPAPVCSDNDSLWSGDHISVALPDVAGVFFSNRKVDGEDVKALQIGPTALDLLGVPVPGEMDLGPIRFQ